MNPPQRSILLLQLGSDTGLALLVARCLGRWTGTRVHLFNHGRSSARHSRHVATNWVVPPASGPGVAAELLLRALEQTKADVLLPVDQEAIRFAHACRLRLPARTRLAPGPAMAALDRADDKQALAVLLEELRIPCPRTVAITVGSDPRDALRELRFPVLLKPTRLSGGRGIRQFDTLSDLVDHVGRHQPLADASIVQEYQPGLDLGCNVLCQSGRILAHTLQRSFLPPARPYQMPAGIEFVRDDAILAMVARLVRALDWSGVANIDLRYEESTGTAYVLEINPRFWGSLLGSLAVGVNFPELACRVALGQELPELEYRPGRFISERRNALRHRLGLLRNGRASNEVPLSDALDHALRDPWPEIVSLLRGLLR